MVACPMELEYVFEAQRLRKKMQDESNWELGIYIQSAVATAVEHNLAGYKARSEYIKEPFSHTMEQQAKEQQNIQKYREAFMASLLTMSENWKLEHKKGETSNG